MIQLQISGRFVLVALIFVVKLQDLKFLLSGVCFSLTLSQLNALHFDLVFNLSCDLSFSGSTAITVLITSTHGGRTRFLLTEQNTVKPEI